LKIKKESDLQKQIVDYLTIKAQRYNFFFYAILNEAFMMTAMMMGMDKKTMAIIMMHLKKMGLIPGIPDLCIGYDACTYYLEIKKLGETPNDIQKRIHALIKENGFQVVVVDNFEDAKRWIDLWIF